MSAPTVPADEPTKGPFLSSTPFPTEVVRIIHNDGLDDESVVRVWAHIQAGAGFFDLATPIFEGDIVESSDPRLGADGLERRLVVKVDVNRAGHASVDHIHVTWGKALPARQPPLRRLTFENLHHQVQAAAGDLFADGHYDAAVQEALKSLEVRVRGITGADLSGVPLMLDAFRAASPKIDVARHGGRSASDERQGFEAIFRGAMLGMRNPGAHELFSEGDPQQALEYLGFASLLHRRIDEAVVDAAV